MVLKASLEEETDDHEPGPLPADLGLDFSPGPSTAAGPGTDMQDTNMVQMKRNIRQAEAQPISMHLNHVQFALLSSAESVSTCFLAQLAPL